VRAGHDIRQTARRANHLRCWRLRVALDFKSNVGTKQPGDHTLSRLYSLLMIVHQADLFHERQIILDVPVVGDLAVLHSKNVGSDEVDRLPFA